MSKKIEVAAPRNQIRKILNKSEFAIIRKLNTPHKIQDFLDTLPFNFEKNGETYFSPRKMLQEKRAHCFEGALFAHLCLTYHGFENFLLDLKVKKGAKKDQDHTLCIFKINNYWGTISKTNHGVLRWRDPVYKNYSELAKSYFHEYFINTGEKTLDSFSKPFDLFNKFGVRWVTADEDLDRLAEALDNSPHIKFVNSKNLKFIRKAGKTEIKGAEILEWHKNGKRV